MFTALIGVAFVLMIIKLVGESYSILELCVCALIGVLVLYNYRLTNNKGLLLCMSMFLMVKRSRIERLCKISALFWEVQDYLIFS